MPVKIINNELTRYTGDVLIDDVDIKKYNLKDLITLIYDKTFYVEQQTGYPNGHKRKENLERLIDIVYVSVFVPG